MSHILSHQSLLLQTLEVYTQHGVTTETRKVQRDHCKVTGWRSNRGGNIRVQVIYLGNGGNDFQLGNEEEGKSKRREEGEITLSLYGKVIQDYTTNYLPTQNHKSEYKYMYRD